MVLSPLLPEVPCFVSDRPEPENALLRSSYTLFNEIAFVLPPIVCCLALALLTSLLKDISLNSVQGCFEVLILPLS